MFNGHVEGVTAEKTKPLQSMVWVTVRAMKLETML